MNEISAERSQRKVLSLKKEKTGDDGDQAISRSPKFLDLKLSVYMVWREGGPLPQRVYRSDEKDRAISHAKLLAKETGHRFYVMRSWRGFDAE